MDRYSVYILTDRPRGVLYTGVTSDLIRWAAEHRDGVVGGFTRRYNAKILVWYEMHADVEAAILREKRIKRWRRAWKLELVEAMNPGWRDLWFDVTGQGHAPG
jgi:putative endonuclease